MLLLTIETSCDETAAAVVKDGREIFSSVVSSQVAVHSEYGGVVPEIASRKHLEMISPVISCAVEDAGITMNQLEGIGVTRGPGLAGALLVGFSMARALSSALKVPLTGVHHIEGHIFATLLENPVEFPFLALVVSGGHTHIYCVEGFGKYKTIGRTIDDAAGEAFDKGAKLMGLPYPGGILIDKMAKDGNPSAFNFPRPMLKDGTLNFSFSGLKTALLNQLRKEPATTPSQYANDLSASYQQAICDILFNKMKSAIELTSAKRVVVSGGVACNSALRASMQKLAADTGIELHIPSPALCGDNAAMLAPAADYYLSNGYTLPPSADSTPTWNLDNAMDLYR